MSLGKKIGFFSAFILPLLLFIGMHIGGFGLYLAFVFGFALLPILDFWIGLDSTNFPDDKISIISKEKYYRFILYAWAYVQTALLLYCFYYVTYVPLQTIEWIGFILSTGTVTGGIGITVAHELGHKRSALQRFFSKVLLMEVYYMHFIVEHNMGHHVHVATPSDPATARRGESFYSFWFRSVFMGYFHAWTIENNRLKKSGNSSLSYKNQMIWYSLAPIFFVGVITTIFTILTGRFVYEIPVFFFGQSLVAFTLLEHVNYIEHYGIVRKEVEPGKFERVNETHSWNTNYLLSNFFLFQLQRHSDHHMNATRPYQVLKQYNNSPQLPAGYPAMVLLSLIPPLWFQIINRRLDASIQENPQPAA